MSLITDEVSVTTHGSNTSHIFLKYILFDLQDSQKIYLESNPFVIVYILSHIHLEKIG